jgi:aryl-alcohol dehydrogenase-like predicted oxidoreductase
LQGVLEKAGVGTIAYSPLARGLLTDRYLGGVPTDSRAASASVFMGRENITEAKLEKSRKLQELALSEDKVWRKCRWPGCCGKGRRLHAEQGGAD